MKKTNAMRLLDGAQICYEEKEYEDAGETVDTSRIPEKTGLLPSVIFKTLVLRADKEPKKIVVCVIPLLCELDLKKAARAAGVKKLEMVHVKELLALTGYVRGGCSPIGMTANKAPKKYPTFVDQSALPLAKMAISAGARGCQIILSPQDLINFTGAVACDLTTD